MKKPLLTLLLFVISNFLFAQMATHNTCASAYDFGIINGSGLTHSSHLYQANQTNVTGCGNRYDVWYRFTMPAGSRAATIRVSLTSKTTTLSNSNTYIELFNTNACGSVNTTSTGCTTIGGLTRAFALNPSSTYYFRVNTTVDPSANINNWNFTVRINSTSNDCGTATMIQPAVPSYTGAVVNATASTGTPAIPAACSGTPDDDVWFKFVAGATHATVSLTGTLTSNGSKIQVFSGPCGGPTAFTSIGCGDALVNLTGLTPGDTFYVRVFSNAVGAPTAANSIFDISVAPLQPGVVGSGRMNEVFRQTIISPPNILADPWEITYGPDDNLWITESKGYKVYKMNPVTGVKTTVLDISQFSTFYSAPADIAFYCQFNNGAGAQGGLAGLALHPNFLDGTPSEKNYVYISYVRSGSGSFFTNRLARFTFNKVSNRLESPVSICDTLPGSNDHNSQRMIIAPVVKGGTKYLFYGSGDMGAGQGNATNVARPIKSQFPNSYEGKILRFNLDTIGDGGTGLAAWIPNDNPYNVMLGVQSAVWNIGQRNNQGFAYDTSRHILYGSSHGPYSDDEINIMEPFKNYGHPMVVGYVADGNYNGTTTPSTSTSLSAGTPFGNNSGNSTCAPIGSEAAQRATIDASGNGLYKDPLFSAYPGAIGEVAGIWGAASTPNNGGWPSEGWSGLDLYSNSLIPGWKRSLVAASLKWGRLVRLKLSATGTATLPNNTINDTISYFGSQNRFRDLAFAPNGKDIYVVMDRSTTTSGPSALFPVVPSCQGCVQKYTFMGYNVNTGSGNRSYIPGTIPVAAGLAATFERANKVVINAANGNNNIWVPITDTNSNIVAEINAQGRDLDTVTTTLYSRNGASRIKFTKKYLNRNLTISPQKQPGGTVWIRLYISKAEYDAFVADGYAGSISALKILKNGDSCLTAISANTELVTTTVAEAFGTNNGYVLQGEISSFSSFYFSDSPITLPVELLTFKGSLQNNSTLLQWETENEINSSHFVVERSIDGRNYDAIGTVASNGSDNVNHYSHVDYAVTSLSATTVYYRLKMVDVDGRFSYSSVVTVYLADITGTVVLSPNPTSGETKLMIASQIDGKAEWRLVDNNGRLVMRDAVLLKKGNNNVAVNVSGLKAGLYYLHVSGAGINQHLKLQKL